MNKLCCYSIWDLMLERLSLSMLTSTLLMLIYSNGNPPYSWTFSLRLSWSHPSSAGIDHVHPDGVWNHLLPATPVNIVEGHDTERRHHLWGDRQSDVGDQLTGHVHTLSLNDFAFIQHLRKISSSVPHIWFFFSLTLCWNCDAVFSSHQVGDVFN